MPVLYPANVQEYLDYGLHGWAMSRYSGCWVAFKAPADTVETSASVRVDPLALPIVVPTDFELPPDGLNIRWPDPLWCRKRGLLNVKLYAALAYARANGLNRVMIDSPAPRLGILTAGKSYLDVRQALDELGIDERLAAAIGIRLYKGRHGLALEPDGCGALPKAWKKSWWSRAPAPRIPVEGGTLQLARGRPAAGHREIRRRASGPGPRRPRPPPHGDWLLPASGELPVATIARVIAGRIGRFTSPAIEARLALIESKQKGGTTPLLPSSSASPTSARMPPQHLDPAAGGFPGGRRHRLPLHGHLDGPEYGHLHPHGGEGSPGWAGALH